MRLSEEFFDFYKSLEVRGQDAFLSHSNILEVLSSSPNFQVLKAKFQACSADEQMLVVLRALETLKASLIPLLVDTELVVTFPGCSSISARHTPQVIRQMIKSAKHEIVVAGFAITEAGGLLAQLVEATGRGAKVILLCSNWESSKGSGNTAARLVQENWPAYVPRPVLYQHSSDEGKTGMHIKCLLVDRKEILLGSANFTFAGLNENFEMGVRLGGQVAQIARGVIDEFIRTGLFDKM